MEQGCLKGVAFGLVLLGALLGLLGLIFIIAAAQEPAHGPAGWIMLGIAVALIIFAASRLRAMKTLSPEGVEQQITAVAAGANGEVTVASVAGVTGLDDAHIRQGLERLVSKGMARLDHRDGTDYYLFAGIKLEKKIKRCPYCGNEYPLAQAGRTCPSCGGNLEIVSE